METDALKHKMMEYCAYRERCVSEVVQKLRQLKAGEEEAVEILEMLTGEGYLDEERYVRSYIRGKHRYKKWGRRKIRQSLLLKGVSPDQIDKCWDEVEEEEYEENMNALLEKKAANIKAGGLREKKAKLLRYALGRGYEYEAVWNWINENLEA